MRLNADGLKTAPPQSGAAFGQEEDHGQGIQMHIFLTGVSCVGKTTIGKKMGKLLGVRFFDLDNEIESFFETSIERLRNRFLTVHSFRNEAAKALVHLLNRPESRDCVIALPPSGLMGGYQRANLQVDISGLYQDQAARKVKEAVEELDGKVRRVRQSS